MGHNHPDTETMKHLCKVITWLVELTHSLLKILHVSRFVDIHPIQLAQLLLVFANLCSRSSPCSSRCLYCGVFPDMADHYERRRTYGMHPGYLSPNFSRIVFSEKITRQFIDSNIYYLATLHIIINN